MLLHNSNERPSIPVAYAALAIESYAMLQAVVNCVNYNKHEWLGCGDFKVIAMLLSMQGCYTKYCYLCEWDSRTREKNYTHSSCARAKKYCWRTSSESEQNYSPTLSLDSWKRLLRNEAEFQEFCNKFPQLSIENMTKGILIGPQIRQLLENTHFESILTSDQMHAWHSFRYLTTLSLVNRRA